MTRVILLFIIISSFLLPQHASSVDWTKSQGLEGGLVNYIHITQLGTIYAGNLGGGAYKSLDDGESWTRILDYNSDLSEITSITVSNSGDIYVAGSDNIYKSSDEGESWTKLFRFQGFFEINMLVSAPDGAVYAAINKALYRTIDDGVTWENILTNGFESLVVLSLLVKDNGTMYAGTDEGLYISNDNGVTWENKGGPNITDMAFDSEGKIYATTQYSGIYGISQDGTDMTELGLGDLQLSNIIVGADNTIIVGTNSGIHASEDAGSTWVDRSFGLSNLNINALRNNSNGKIFAGTMGSGIFGSDDNAYNWYKINSGFASVIATCFHESQGGVVFAGTMGDGIYSSGDNGQTWGLVLTGIESYWVTSFAESEQGVLFASSYLGIFRSDAGGGWWYKISGEMTSPFLSLLIDDNGDIYSGTYFSGVFKSTDGGDSWMSVSSGLPYSLKIWDLAKLDNGDILLASSNGGIFRTTDQGGSWTMTSQGIAYGGFENMELDSEGNIYICLGENGLYKSTDHGYSWIQIENPDNYSFMSMQFDNNGNIYTGTLNNGILRSSDGATSWEVIGDKAEMPVAAGLLIDDEQRLFAGTGYGVYVTDEPVGVDESKLSNTDLLSVYPNPASEYVNLNITTDKAGPVILHIYNSLGYKVGEISDRFCETGSNSFEIDTGHLPQGIYYIRMNISEISICRSFCITR